MLLKTNWPQNKKTFSENLLLAKHSFTIFQMIYILFTGPDLTWKQFMCHITNQDDSIFYDNLKEILLDRYTQSAFNNVHHTNPLKNLGSLSSVLE